MCIRGSLVGFKFRQAVLLLALSAFAPSAPAMEPSDFFEIQVIDQETGRGIPLVELVTVDDVRRVTDNAGRVAYFEPGHAGRTIFFHIKAQGYHVPTDGFGMSGFRFKIEPGKRAEIKLKRENLAERLYRCTGEGLYRDSVLLGHETPLENPLTGAGQVAGQDSVLVVKYRGKLYWFWGDTMRLFYPLGLFRTAGAVSDLPENGGLPPSAGVNYEYFTGEDGFARAMAEVADPEGVVWLDGLAVVPDEGGEERMVAHFSRRKTLADEVGQGMMLYDDRREIFEVHSTLPLSEKWRYLKGHPVPVAEGGTTYLASGLTFPLTRVPATLADVMNPEKYESFSCMAEEADPKTALPLRTEDGRLDWRWRHGPPVSQEQERRWLKTGDIRPEEARFFPEDAATGRRVMLHYGSVFFNEFRRKWILIAEEISDDKNSPSFLGEVWYSESDSPQGPFQRAVRIVTHDKQSFYNPRQHPFFDEEGGRVIYFEGTYCNTFTDSPPTPRYNYNQVMYRLDLGCKGIGGVFGEKQSD